ncbi:MAG: ChbG/HpnK family deacetylase [Bdellovibrionales bacterium]|nr:ChbG/HpnK family deacetylase [Bdellovibrionales bacterium]
MTRSFHKIFAADDWGFSPAINEGILHLAERGWLRSVSCAGNAPYLQHGIERLRTLDVTVSLHLCFTYGSPLSTSVPSLVRGGKFLSHRHFMLKGMTGRIASEDLVREFTAQLATLRAQDLQVEMLDGHHHVHLLPFVAHALTPHLESQGIRRLRALRDPAHIFSYAQTVFFQNFIGKNREMAFCHYLRPADLRSRATLIDKIDRAGERPLLVHPASYNDFSESEMTDGLRGARVHEFQQVVTFLNE